MLPQLMSEIKERRKKSESNDHSTDFHTKKNGFEKYSSDIQFNFIRDPKTKCSNSQIQFEIRLTIIRISENLKLGFLGGEKARSIGRIPFNDSFMAKWE